MDLLKKHALVILAAVLVATYRLLRLESERTQLGENVEQSVRWQVFENAVNFLQRHLDTKYRVLRIAPQSNSATKLRALIVNRGFSIPHVEAEVFVDQQLVLHQRKQKRRKHAFLPPVRFRVYDVDTMTPVAKTLVQQNLIASFGQGDNSNRELHFT